MNQYKLGSNDFVVMDGHIEIVLRGKDGAEAGRALIDVEDLALVYPYRWCAQTPGRTPYALSRARRERVYMHRLLLGAPAGMEVDHWNGDGLDNRRANIKLVTRKRNAENMPLSSANKSGYRGVSWHKETGKWRAVVKHDYEQHYLGLFDDAHEAGRAAHEAREALFTNHQTRI